MYHPMLTYAVMKTRMDDLDRELRREAQLRSARTTRARVRRRVRWTSRPRTTVTQVSSSPC
jgi:hypothetical protein